MTTPNLSAAHRAPSPYQQAIYDLVPTGVNIQVNAVAGSGKTTTLEGIVLRLSPEERAKTRLLSFGKKITEEMERRMGRLVVVSTMHSAGRQALKEYYEIHAPEAIRSDCWRDKPRENTRKYRELCRRALEEVYSDVKPGVLDPVTELTDKVRVTLTNWSKMDALLRLIDRFGLDIPTGIVHSLPAIIGKVFAWGAFGEPPRDMVEKRDEFGLPPPDPTSPALGNIDFTDMLWLPLMLGAPVKQWDRILVDECQDLSKLQQELLCRMLRPGGQAIFVGDPYQAIFGFAGADSQAYEAIRQRFQTVEMPLSVCYRCPQIIVAHAREIVPHIEAAPGAAKGVISQIYQEDLLLSVNVGDVVLCRTNDPIITAAYQLIRSGKPAKVLGRNIGAGLRKVLREVAAQVGFTYNALPKYADLWCRHQIALLRERGEPTPAREEGVYERGRSLVAVFDGEGSRSRSVKELDEAIQTLFSDAAEKDMVILSSIHKAKGLEYERVFLLRPELLPHPMATTTEEQDQEVNLDLVARTRARHELCYVWQSAESKSKHLARKRE